MSYAPGSPKNTQPRIVTWRAVSSEEQAEKESLDHQHRLNLEHVARWGGVVVAHLEVPGISRNIVLWEDACKQIEAYAALNELLERRAFDILMCYDVTRLGRDRALIVTTASLCERAGIRIYETASPPVSLEGPHSTADSRLLLTLKGHMSEEETRKFAERSRFGRQARVKKGKHAGNPPYGYKRLYDNDGVSYTVVDDERAVAVRLFYDLLLNHGRSLTLICAELNTLGYFSPQSKNPWVPGTLRQMLKNRWAYAGYTTWGTLSRHTPVEGVFRAKAEWEPLITEDMAREAEIQLKARSFAPRAVSSPYRFSMVARCGYCGGNIIVKNRAGKSGCISNRFACHNNCHGSATGDPEMMADIERLILNLGSQDFLESLIDETPDHYLSMAQRRDEAAKALDQVRAERKRLTLLFTRDSITLDEFEEIMAELQTRHDDLAHTVAELEQAIATTPTAETRRLRLQEVRDRGLDMLHHPDNKTANTWLRQHIVLYILDYKIHSRQIL